MRKSKPVSIDKWRKKYRNLEPKRERAEKVAVSSIPLIEYLYRDETGQINRRVKVWKRPQTEQAIAEWMADYFAAVERGYLPEGFRVAPVPYCARVTLPNGKLVAEWQGPREKTG